MSYLPPDFNVDCNIWHQPHVPPAVPDLFSVCQLYVNSRTFIPLLESDDTQYTPPVWLRAPAGTDLRRGDLVESRAGSNFFYHVRWVERMHLGFPNEYVAAMMNQIVTGPPPPPPTGFILMEDGFIILTETGFGVLLE